jgi:hypothetical protein
MDPTPSSSSASTEGSGHGVAVPQGGVQPPASSNPSRVRAHTISVFGHEEPFGVHSLQLGRAVYVWCGTGTPRLAELVAAAPPPAATAGTTSSTTSTSAGSASSLLMSSGLGDRDEEEAFGRLLARKLGSMVFLSWNVPPERYDTEVRMELQRAVLAHLLASGGGGKGGSGGAGAGEGIAAAAGGGTA